MSDFISSSDLLKEANLLEGVSTPSVLGSGKNVQVSGWTEPEKSIKFDKTQSYGTPTKLLENTIQTESSGNPHAVNPQSGAMGIGQFMPETVAMLHKQGIEFNPFKADESRAAMDYYINTLAKKHGGDYTKAMSEYGGFKTKDPSTYLAKVLEGVDNTGHDKDLIKSEILQKEAESLGIPESELTPKEKLTAGRVAGLVTRGMTPAVVGAAAGQTLAGPTGALIGSMALPAGDILNTGVNAITGGINRATGAEIPQLQMPSGMVQQWMTKAGLPVPQSTAERMIESGSGALAGAGTQIPAMSRLATTAITPTGRSLAGQLSQAPVSQAIAAPISAAVGQGVAEKTESPTAGMVAGMAVAAPFGFRLKQEALNAPKQESLITEAKNLYNQAEQSGIRFNTNKFADEMFRAGHELRQEGFTPKAYPGIDSVINEMARTDVPKDFTELQAIRKMIQGQQKSADPETRRLAGILKDNFDDYVLNAPKDHITVGGDKGMKLWQDARQTYSKLKKAEIFDDMLENAQLDKSKFTASGEENSLAMQLRNLSKNDKKMRTFSAEEQKAIKEAAKGGTIQNMLKFYGRFAPTGPVSLIPSMGGIVLNPYIGVPVTAGALGSRYAATQLRKNAITNLADMMRLGRAPEVESRMSKVPATALRGLLSGIPESK